MIFEDKQSRLHLKIKDDLRQRELNAWNAAFRAWRIAHGVFEIPLGKLSGAEYHCGVLYAALVAGWIEASGRLDEAGQLTDEDALPAAEQLDDWPAGLVQWYGERVSLAYAKLFDISPNSSGRPRTMPKARARRRTNS